MSQKKVRSGRKIRGRKNTSNGKIRLLFVFALLLFLCLLVRLFYLQVLISDDLTRMALTQMTRRKITHSDRGLIFDRGQKKLVSNVSRSRIVLDNRAVQESEEKEKIIKKLKEEVVPLLEISPDIMNQALEKEGTSVLASSIDRTKALELKAMNVKGIAIEDYESRSYPNGRLASHIIGFTNRDGDGLYGIEKYYNDTFRGIAGKSIVFSDIYNNPMPGVDTVGSSPTEGLNATLTISESVQKSMEEILDKAKEQHKAKRVSAIVQNTKTGEILAMGSSEEYNLNAPRSPQNEAQKQTWDKLSQEQKQDIWYENWRNFSVSDLYEPGSTFKTITAAAALEENTTNPEKHYYCTGYIRDLKGITITCTSLPNPHGDITMAKGYAESCNTTFVNIARELGKESFYKYIEGFGFGEPTGIDLPSEESGIVPKSPENISDVGLATMSYGHGIAVTPIQMVTAVSAVANGGKLMEPHMVLKWTDKAGNVVWENEPKVKRQVISEKTSQTMRELMEQVVEEGTGTLGAVNGYRIGGKTGTADKVSEAGGYEEDKYISSFVCVGPVENPEVTVLVIVEEPEGDYYGATVASPLASKIMEIALKEEAVPKSSVSHTTKTEKVLVPDVESLLLEDAGRKLSEVGLKFNAPSGQISDLGIVMEQSPLPGTEVEVGSIVELTLDPNDTNKKKIPRLTGKTAKEVEEILKDSEFSYEMEGEGVVVEQSPQGGEVVEKATRIRIKLSPPLSEKEKEENNSKNEEKTNE